MAVIATYRKPMLLVSYLESYLSDLQIIYISIKGLMSVEY